MDPFTASVKNPIFPTSFATCSASPILIHPLLKLSALCTGFIPSLSLVFLALAFGKYHGFQDSQYRIQILQQQLSALNLSI